MSSPETMHRRGFLSTLTTVAALAVPAVVSARRVGTTFRTLRFEHLHTGERLVVEYAQSNAYVPDALDAVNRLLRDFRTGDVHPIDTQLLDLLHRLTQVTDTNRPFQVISGYRSPATNAMLRGHSEGVAAHSLHMDGMAIDIRLADVALPRLRQAALDVGRGGVGFYPKSNFVHVDTGRVRTW
jgi:uncharacterized protein YcbK (DUF882 family)